MEQVYIVVENGVSYPNAYFTYNLAVNAIKLKYSDWNENSINGACTRLRQKSGACA